MCGSQRDEWISQLWSFPKNRWAAFPLSVRPVSHDPSRGLGVFSLCSIPKHRLVLEYCGELLTPGEKQRRDEAYAQRSPFPGSYAFEFRHDGCDWARDATEVGADDADGALRWGYGRYVNHSREQCNVYGRVIAVHSVPRLCFFSARHIDEGEELLIDYADRSKENRQANPWLDH